MLIRFGYELTLEFEAAAPLVLMLRLRPEKEERLRSLERIEIRPLQGLEEFADSFGNRCTRLIAPGGALDIACDGLIEDSGRPSGVFPSARQHPVDELPHKVLPFLLPSRYCDMELLAPLAWAKFGNPATPGWRRVQDVCDWVHGHLRFDYGGALPTRTAHQALVEKTGVCRDFTHLAIAICRCLNIPARYTTGYLGDIGVPPDPTPMDFSAWMEAYLGGRWHVFDVRHNARRIGHLPMAHGRDAADVAFVTSFGRHFLTRFVVKTEQVTEAKAPLADSGAALPLEPNLLAGGISS